MNSRDRKVFMVAASKEFPSDVDRDTSNNRSPTGWDAYATVMQDVILRVVPNFLKTLSHADIRAVQAYLLNPEIVVPLFVNYTASAESFRNAVRRQRESFVAATGFTKGQLEFCTFCLNYLGDMSAKHQSPASLQYGWYKLRESGLVPREKCVSTYMYVLGLSRELQEECFQVASFHDQLFQPNEKTITLRIKTLIARGDTQGAEQVLASLPDKDDKSSGNDSEFKRLRTFQAILSYYCEQNNVPAALRLFSEMRQSKGVHIDADTYALLVATLAKCGCFVANGQAHTVSGCEDKNSMHSLNPGPSFLDKFFSIMAEDLIELNEKAVATISDGFENACLKNMGGTIKSSLGPSFFDSELTNSGNFIVGRVSVDPLTGKCPATGSHLRLIALTTEQRQHVHDTLLDMAAAQQREYVGRLKFQGKPLEDHQSPAVLEDARESLGNFSKWLRDRPGAPFSAFVDGPNVCFYGHNKIHYSQVKAVVEELEQYGETPLIIMPSKYMEKSFWLPGLGEVQVLFENELTILNQLMDSGKLYSVPVACLDDYYWMLASVANQSASALNGPLDRTTENFPGLRPLLVTNDQMRDHRLSLLEPREFLRWTSCHIVKYEIAPYKTDEWEPRQVSFHPADMFSCEIQGNSHPDGCGSLVWHFPVAEWPRHDRFCVYIPPA